jgi:hypothetical protein
MTVVPAAAATANGVTLTRSPYVTDLTASSAEVNWAVTFSGSQPAGSVMVEQEPAGGCGASTVTSWSPNAVVSPTPMSIPYQASGSTATTTGWSMTVNGLTEFQNSVPVTGLGVGTTYCYDVFSSDTASTASPLLATPQQFTTLFASPAATVDFDVIGDTGENYEATGTTSITPFSPGSSLNPYQADLYRSMAGDGSQFLLEAGDLSYSGGTQTTMGDLQQTIPPPATDTTSEVSNLFGPEYLPRAEGLPLFIADGNHGQQNFELKAFPSLATATGSAGAYAFDQQTVDGVSGQFPDDWYAFTDGGVRIYVLDASWADSADGTDTNVRCSGPAGVKGDCKGYQMDDAAHWQPTSAEMEWLQGDLAAHRGVMKMAVFHYPLRSVVATQPDDQYLQQDLEPVLAGNDFVMAFNGHAHSYQRIDPTVPGEIDSYVVGGGGGSLEPLNGTNCAADKQTATIYALGFSSGGGGSVCASSGLPTAKPTMSQVYSYLRVQVSGNTIIVNPVNADGKVFDPMTYVDVNGVPAGSPGGTVTPAPPPTTTSPANPPSSPASAACLKHLPTGTVVGTAALPDGSGYYEVDSAGDVAAFGAANCYGAMTGLPLNKPVVGMAIDPATGGYWLVATDGGIFAFNAPFLGSTGAMHLNRPVVGMTASPDGQGYWLVASDGGIFSFGDAAFYGSTGSMHLNKPVVGMAAAPGGHGYWLVASDGGIFAFGSAGFFGSTGSMHLNQPIVNMEATGDGQGYRLIASDGGVFDFGSAPFYGSAGSIKLNRPMIGGADDNATGGYWLMASDGGVFTYNAPFYGSAA